MIADDLYLKLNSETHEHLFDEFWSYFNTKTWFQLKAGLEIPLNDMFDMRYGYLHEMVKRELEDE